jgi:hypothetical protein
MPDPIESEDREQAISLAYAVWSTFRQIDDAVTRDGR